jgi:hypothetical protein
MKTNLNKIRSKSPCTSGWTKLLKHLGKTVADDVELDLLTILESNGLDDTLWCLRAVDGFDKEKRLMAVAFAREVQHLMKDQRSIAALDVAEKFANGEATQGELELAAHAAAAASAAADARTDAYAAHAAASAAAAASARTDAYAAHAAARVAAAYAAHAAARVAAADAADAAYDAYDAAAAAYAAHAAARVAAAYAADPDMKQKQVEILKKFLEES